VVEPVYDDDRGIDSLLERPIQQPLLELLLGRLVPLACLDCGAVVADKGDGLLGDSFTDQTRPLTLQAPKSQWGFFWRM